VYRVSVRNETRRAGATRIDWGLGRYERTAAHLYPAARVVVDHAAPGKRERVLDVGCGTGNATLLAAARGARVMGIDPATRLLRVARERAAVTQLDATFVAGEAASLPIADASIDLVLSVFGVIFAPDVTTAAEELARVTAPDGRIVLSAWIPQGAMHDAACIARHAITQATGAPTGPPPFAWHDREALASLFGSHGFAVSLQHETVWFTAPSPLEYLVRDYSSHPLAVAGREVLEPRGKLEGLARSHARDPRSSERGPRELPGDQPLRHRDRSTRVARRRPPRVCRLVETGI
jgi:ubiquinone/menaquinone biosynthesis C-methylase UbiE